MRWEEIRERLPHQWLLLEAIEAHSEGNKRIVEQLAVLESFADSVEVMRAYSEYHRKWPQRELLFLHTDRETIDITERRWLGIRPGP